MSTRVLSTLFHFSKKAGERNLDLAMGQLFWKLIPSETRDNIIFAPKKIFDTLYFYKYEMA